MGIPVMTHSAAMTGLWAIKSDANNKQPAVRRANLKMAGLVSAAAIDAT